MTKPRTTGRSPCKSKGCGHPKKAHVHVETKTKVVVTRCMMCDCKMFKR